MYGTCETLCRELAVKYPGYTPLMLVIWSPEEIQALADGMDISLSDPEIRTVPAELLASLIQTAEQVRITVKEIGE